MVQHVGLQAEGEDGAEDVMATFESGESIDLRILSLADDNGPCLRFIDPYGDTIFNLLQAPELIAELTAIREKLPDPEFIANVDRMIHFLQTSGDDVHTYFRFMGD